MSDTDEKNALLELFGGVNPIQEAFPGDYDKQWITAALIIMAKCTHDTQDEALKTSIMNMLQKAPVDCLLVSATMSVTAAAGR